MKIAFVYDTLYPFTKGGGEKRYWEIARRLVGEHEPHMVSWKYWDGPDTIQSEGVWLHGIGKPRGLYTEEGRRSIREAVEFGIQAVRFARLQRFDVIDCCAFPYFHLPPTRVLSMFRHEPLVVTWHEYWDDYWKSYLGPLAAPARLVEWAVSGLGDHCIAVSQHTADRLRTRGRYDNPITVLPNGIDFEAVHSQPATGPESDIIYVGRLIAHKRLDLLLDALALLKQRGRSVRCLIVGNGPEESRLVELASSLGLESAVTFYGTADEGAIYGLIKRSRALVMPSEREGFGMVVIEAAACGIPSIVVRGPYTAASDIVRDGVTGLVVDRNTDALAAAIQQMVDNPETTREWGAAARIEARRYDWSAIVAQALAVYETAARVR